MLQHHPTGSIIGSEKLNLLSEMSMVPDSQAIKRRQEILVFPRELTVESVPCFHKIMVKNLSNS